MRICKLFEAADPVISFEFFPPKTDEGAEQLLATVAELQGLRPGYVSVTYGAGGSTRSRTLELVARIKREIGIETMAHLTCVGHSRMELAEIVQQLVDAGIENVLALRGDPPKGESEFRAARDGFTYASELVAFLRQLGAPICIGAACYPEKHPEAGSLQHDLDALRRKVDAGADFLVTQLFFDNEDYFYFVRRAKEVGVTLPITPGIWPITNYKQIDKIAQLCGARLPTDLRTELEDVKDSVEAVAGVGVSYALDQCRDLLERGAPGLHFYTLNKSPATRAILARLRHRG
ncbi:MAG: methylenetetrahydrofolate reductase [NAD(P)H] [Planctomycetota bacterium]